MHVTHHHRTRAFSLLEISIVLVILGLLAGAILLGQSLMRAAELRAIVSEHQTYSSAVANFQQKYHAMPGDMSNATNYWGHTGGAGCANATATIETTPGTCDGNGNNKIEYGTVGGQSGESFQGWRQLALAGLIEGNYSGVAGVTVHPTFGATDHNFDANSPLSKLDGVGWGLSYVDNILLNDPNIYHTDYTNWLTIGRDDGVFADDAFLTGSEAWHIDDKLDDGMPATGNVQATTVTCTATPPTSNTDFTGKYPLDINTETIACSLLFKQKL